MRISLFFLLSIVASFANAQEVLLLDTYEDPEPGNGATTPVFTAGPLLAGQDYEIVLEGTISLASPSDWVAPPPCGSVDPTTTFPSPVGTMDGATGMDPFYFFAVPDGFCGAVGTLPALVPLTTMSFDGGASFGLPPLAAPPAYSPEHRYSFTVTGQGQLAGFRYEDDFLPNNYGQIRITVTAVATEIPTTPLWILVFGVLLMTAVVTTRGSGLLLKRN